MAGRTGGRACILGDFIYSIIDVGSKNNTYWSNLVQGTRNAYIGINTDLSAATLAIDLGANSFQIAFYKVNNEMYYRSYKNDSWNSWITVAKQ